MRAHPTLIRGVYAIAQHLGIGASEADHLHRRRQLPTFSIPGDNAPHATAGGLDEWVAVSAKPSVSSSEPPISPSVDAMLSDLAKIWVDRWLAHGGWLTVDRDCNNVGLGMRLDGKLWRSRNPYGHHHWHDGWKVGRWRELSELAGLVPGLRGAIIHRVAEIGALDADGSYQITRSAAEMGVA